MRTARRKAFIAAQLAAAAIVIFFIGRDLAQQWVVYRGAPLAVHPRWGLVAAASALVLLVYGLLVQTWRVLLPDGTPLPFWRAARIWSISNLYRYVPGKVWQIGAMSAMAARENVPPASAASAALISTVLNIAAGLALVVALAWRWVALIDPSARAAALALIALAIAGIVALPFVAARVSAWASRTSGRPVVLAAPRFGALVAATAGNLLAWSLYGVAFAWLVHGVIGVAAGAMWQYVAVYTASYVFGYLFLVIPGGIGPREGAMYALLTNMHLATGMQALVIAGASRVWLTILEIVPGLLFLLNDLLQRRANGIEDVGNS